MELTYEFLDFDLIPIPPKRKNGRTKHEFVKNKVIDTLIPAMVSPFDKNMQLYVRESLLKKAKETHGRRYLTAYLVSGATVTGLWQHGRYGNMIHREMVYFEYAPDGLRLVSESSYAGGQKKDQHKYLKGIE